MTFAVCSLLLTNYIIPTKNVAAVVDKPTLKYATGYIQPDFTIAQKSQQPNLVKSVNLPSKYDLRDLNALTAIRDQGGIGDCWAFATMASLESNLLINKDGAYDFSEINLAVNHGRNLSPIQGGNYYMSTAYLARWEGPVSEADDPNPNPATPDNIIPRSGIAPEKHIQNVLFIPKRNNFTDNDLIKQAVMNYGAVATTMSTAGSLNEETNAFYNNDSYNIDHGVNIVGWDDNYSRYNFLTTPPGDGAFIVRNSWGESFGDAGYFYISYYDVIIGRDNAVFIDAEPVNNYSKIYQYDPLGFGGGFSYGNTNWFSNVFTTDNTGSDTQLLSAVSFYTREMNTYYEVYAETDYDTKGFSNIKSQVLASGSFNLPGYHTVKLNAPLVLTSNKKFAVAVKIYNPTGSLIVEEDYDYELGNDNLSLANQSFISPDGITWEGNEAGEQNVCLKAFTTIKYSVPVTGIALNTTSITLNPEETYKLTADIKPAGAINKTVLWTSSNESVAVVDDNGNVKAIKVGAATITATSFDGSFKSQCFVKVGGVLEITNISQINTKAFPTDGEVILNFNSNLVKGRDFNNIKLIDENGAEVSKTLNINNNVLTIKPSDHLKADGLYIVKVPLNSVTDGAGNLMDSDFNLTFVTTKPYNSKIEFGSAYLENAVRKSLGKPVGDISSEDMKRIYSLTISTYDISSLKGLEYAINLNWLSIFYANLRDISAIKHLIKLTYVNLPYNAIENIEALRNLTNLSTLRVNNNRLSDISAIENLTKLEKIDISYNSISDISPLYNLTGKSNSTLKNANVSYNYINTKDQNVIEKLNILKNRIETFSNWGQNTGAQIIYPSDLSTNYECSPFDSFSITFKNPITKGAGFDNIQLFCFGDNDYVDSTATITGNVLVIKPAAPMMVKSSYSLEIPKNAITDSEGKQFDEPLIYYLYVTEPSYDINTDGNVTISDLNSVADKYGTTVNDTSWNSSCDSNLDGMIDIFDIVNFSRHVN